MFRRKPRLSDDEWLTLSTWVSDEVGRRRQMGYEELLQMKNKPIHVNVTLDSGDILVGESIVFWDDQREQRNLRVIVDVWDPRRRVSRSIVSEDFIRAPDGSFIGE